jgi:hypothetical protein
MRKEFYNLLKEDILYVLKKYPDDGGLSAMDCFEIAMAVFQELEACGEID